MRSPFRYEAIDSPNKFLNLLARATDELGTSLDLEETLMTACRLPVPLLAEWAVLFLNDTSGLIPQPAASYHQNEEAAGQLKNYLGKKSQDFIEYALVTETIQRGEPMLSEIPGGEIPAIRRSNLLSLPLRHRSRITGVLCFGLSIPSQFPPEDVLIAQDLAQRAAVAIENAKLYQRAIETERRLSEAKRVLEETSRFKTQFLANMSHEIRTPIGAILGFVELLMTPGYSDAERREWAGRIRYNGRHLLRLINDILNLTKVESGKLEVQTEEVDLARILDEIEATMMWPALDKNIRFQVGLATPVPAKFLADPTRLHQIIINVVSNAIKFTHKGNVSLEVHFDSEKEILSFDIRDSGIGISPEHASKIFQPFTQADASLSRRYGGTGLGLALSRKIAHLLNGDIELVDSQPGHGSHFRIWLRTTIPPDTPLISVLDPKSSRKEQSIEQPCKTLSLGGARILVIDDSPDNQVLLSRMLNSSGANVTIAENGDKALQILSSHTFDLILTDIQMPGKDGYQTTREIRALGFKGPVIALTAHALPEEREKCLQAGCDEHLAKPVSRATLIETVHRLLNRV